MALKGNLKDLALLEILQVVAFSKKTGVLQLEGSFGRGGVVFKDGLVYCAYSPATIDLLRSHTGTTNAEEDQAILVEQTQIALRELVGLREGEFRFGLTPEPPKEINGLNVASIALEEGVNTQGLLLNLAKEMDDERQQTSEIFESAFENDLPRSILPVDPSSDHESMPESTDEPTRSASVVVVDDEEMVTQIISTELRSQGYDVVTSGGPADGFSAVRSLVESGRKVVLVTDLRMPTTTGRSFLGGFELVRTLRRSGFQVPVLLMTEKLTPKVRARAMKLGIKKAVFKSALSKLDPTQYEADLRSFAAVVGERLGEIAGVDAREEVHTPPSESDGKTDRLLDFLTDMTEKLLKTTQPGEISRMALSVASKYTERGILFLLKGDAAHGVAGFGLSNSTKETFELPQKLVVNVHQVDLLAEVVQSRSARRSSNLDALEPTLLASIGRAQSSECILIPMLNNREVLAVLYADNSVTGRPLGKLRGLELFLTQAGMALENLTLHRKLSLFQSKLSSGHMKAKQD